jgi:release factor glutamine methyltransferase
LLQKNTNIPMLSPITYASALQHAIQSGLDRIDAELLLLHVADQHGNSRAWLRSHDAEQLDSKRATFFENACQRRLSHEPLAYIIGERGFYGLILKVDARVLDPRPDTEILVDWTLELLQSIPNPRVADLGTGSGAIGLAIQHQRPDAHVLAVDSSSEALMVAQANAIRLKLPVSFALGSWLEPLANELNTPGPTAKNAASEMQRWHLIASNPPYITEENEHLPALRHEPREALTSGPDGLNDIRHLVQHTPEHLHPGGWLVLEHGYDQAETVRQLMRSRGFMTVSSRKDLVGIERCTAGQWLGLCNGT